MRRGLAIGLLCLASGCGGTPPTYVTSQGIQVWDAAHHFSADEIERLSQIMLDELQGRWPEDKARAMLAESEIDVLDVRSYETYGERVAGSVTSGSLRITIAGSKYHLSSTALAHEWVHYLDLRVHGKTDDSHESWKTDGTYTALTRIQQTMQMYEEPPAEGGI